MLRKIDNLENRSRRNNLVIWWLEEAPNENEQELRGEVIERIFRDKLGVSVTSVERIHRMGKSTEDRPRPVILNLGNFNEKREILHNAKKFKGTNVFINEDYSSTVKLKRQKLWHSASKDRKNGKKSH